MIFKDNSPNVSDRRLGNLHTRIEELEEQLRLATKRARIEEYVSNMPLYYTIKLMGFSNSSLESIVEVGRPPNPPKAKCGVFPTNKKKGQKRIGLHDKIPVQFNPFPTVSTTSNQQFMSSNISSPGASSPRVSSAYILSPRPFSPVNFSSPQLYESASPIYNNSTSWNYNNLSNDPPNYSPSDLFNDSNYYDSPFNNLPNTPPDDSCNYLSDIPQSSVCKQPPKSNDLSTPLSNNPISTKSTSPRHVALAQMENSSTRITRSKTKHLPTNTADNRPR